VSSTWADALGQSRLSGLTATLAAAVVRHCVSFLSPVERCGCARVSRDLLRACLDVHWFTVGRASAWLEAKASFPGYRDISAPLYLHGRHTDRCAEPPDGSNQYLSTEQVAMTLGQAGLQDGDDLYIRWL